MKKTISLAGEFALELDPEKKGLEEHYELPSMTYTDTILLPNTTSAAGKGPENPETPTGFLTDLHKFEGFAWFRKELHFEEEDLGKRILLRMERTRISTVFIDETKVGTYNSLCGEHLYDLSNAIVNKDCTLTICISNVDYPVGGGHMTSPDTQTNWLGILGAFEITVYEEAHFTHLRTECDYEGHAAIFKPEILAELPGDYAIGVSCKLLRLSEDDTLNSTVYAPKATFPVHLEAGANTPEFVYALGEDAPTWDEWNPNLYEFELTLERTDREGTAPESADNAIDVMLTTFGLKDFRAKDMHFYINGRKTFLRGKHDGMIFPLTGYAPMDVDGWLKVMRVAKSYGINHYRFHTCCPPEAAFLAADLLGIYLQPEVPFWGTFTTEGDEGHNAEGQQYLILEGFRILYTFSNHPSFCMMSMGNELWGSAEAINEMMGAYKAEYPMVLYTQGSNNFQWVPNIQPNDDFFSGVRFTIDRQIRGSYAMCDKPQGHVQVARPSTKTNYNEAIFPSYSSGQAEADEDGYIEIQYGTGVKKVKLTEATGELIPSIPVVSHEIGQYVTFPNLEEIQKYTGVTRARNFEIFGKRLEEKGLRELNYDYFKNSGALAVACYKDEFETALRSDHMAGFQVLDIQDFSGQGTALVGILDAFMEPKGIVSREDFVTFCGEDVLQAEFDSYTVKSGESFTADLTLSHYGSVDLPAGTLTATLLSGEKTIALATLSVDHAIENGVLHAGQITLALPSVDRPEKLTLLVQYADSAIRNRYTLWIYPEITCEASYVSTAADALAATDDHVLFLAPAASNPYSIEGTYSADFWCYHMFASISDWMKKDRPIGTMGLLIEDKHPIFDSFPTETYSTPQWWDIVMNSRSTILDETRIRPTVMTIDNYDRNHRLGLIYEVSVAGKHIVVCTSDLPKLVAEGNLQAAWLLKSLSDYVAGSQKTSNALYAMTSEEFLQLFADREVNDPIND